MSSAVLVVIKLIQTLMLLASLLAFGYGAWHLGDALWLRATGEVVTGRVVSAGATTEQRSRSGSSSSSTRYYTVTVYYPEVQYAWPPGSGEMRVVGSPLGLEGPSAEDFRRGKQVQVRVDPDDPGHARPILPLAAYLWPGVGFAAGLMGLLLVGGLFFLHEGAFGRDLSAGVSLFRSLRLRHVVITAAVIGLGWWGLRIVAPWLGTQELTAIATGEIRYLYPLLKARGEPPPGQPLNAAEASLAKVPVLGIAYASTALEAAIRHREKGDVKRFLDAYADPAITFPIQSWRALNDAIDRRDLDTVTRMLALGFKPQDAQFDPVPEVIRANRPDLLQALADAGARLDTQSEPNQYARLALEARAESTFLWLMDRGLVDTAATDPGSGDSLLDQALNRGLPKAAEALAARGVPSRLPPYAKAVVDGDVDALRAALPESRWAHARVGRLPLLHLAAQLGHAALVHALLEARANPNVRISTPDNPRATALHLAVQAGHAGVVTALLTYPKLDLDRTDGHGNTALGYALTTDRWDIVRLLVEAGADPNQKVNSKDGETALHFAARKGDAEAVRFLLAHGANPTVGSFSQVLPVEVARANVRDLLTAPAR